MTRATGLKQTGQIPGIRFQHSNTLALPTHA